MVVPMSKNFCIISHIYFSRFFVNQAVSSYPVSKVCEEDVSLIMQTRR